jgi:hypothetical protein
MNQISCPIPDYYRTTSLDWGKFGVTLITNLCNAFIESFLRGLKILVSGVQISVLALLKTPHYLWGFQVFSRDTVDRRLQSENPHPH